MIPKFRAWNKKLKEMFEVSFIDFDTKLIGLNIDLEIIIFDFDDVILMGSTGLFDKNGKEVFEGDILTDGHTLGVLRNHQTLGFYMVDEKGKENFLSDTVDTEGFEEAKEFMENSIEIIGNIYENPELLEEKE